jgi:hypothetical protein
MCAHKNNPISSADRLCSALICRGFTVGASQITILAHFHVVFMYYSLYSICQGKLLINDETRTLFKIQYTYLLKCYFINITNLCVCVCVCVCVRARVFGCCWG